MSVDNDTENELLVAARNGDTRAILEIQNLRTVINEKGILFCLLLIFEVIFQFCKQQLIKEGHVCHFTGKSKAFKGWAAIHLAAYFGNYEVVKLLLEVC